MTGPSGSNGSTPRSRPVVAVVGGGVAGLAAAWELVGGAAGADADGPVPEVVLLESAERLGGKVRAEPFAGRRVDVAADAFLARRPEAVELCAELGLSDALVPVGASGAAIWARGRLREMPEGLNLGVPTRWWPLLRSGLLGPGSRCGCWRTWSPPIWRPGRPSATGRWGRSSGGVWDGPWWSDWPTPSSAASTPGTPIG